MSERTFLENLAGVVGNYVRAGVQHFVLAGAVRDQRALDHIAASIPVPLRVVRLDVPIDVIERRLEADPTEGRRDDLRVAATWLSAGTGAGLEDMTIGNDQPIAVVATTIIDWLGWPVAVRDVRRMERTSLTAVQQTLGWSGLGVAEAAGECGQQLLGQRGDLVEHGGEARFVEDVQAAVAEGADRRRSRTTVEQGELAEVVAPLQLGGDLAVVLDGRLAAGDDVEVVARFALRADDLAGGDLDRLHHQRDAVDLGRQQAGEQRNGADELLQLGPRRHGPTLPRT